MGQLDARDGARFRPTSMQALFPDPFNADTWNLNGAVAVHASIHARHLGDVRDALRCAEDRRLGAGRLALGERLTLNLGLRYDC